MKISTLLRLRACLHGGGVPQIGEVTRLGGVTHLSRHIISHFNVITFTLGGVTRHMLPHLPGVPQLHENRP